MLGRMAGAGHHPPLAPADRQHLAVDHAAVGVRQRVQRLAEAAEAGGVVVERVLVPAGGAVELQPVLRRLAAGVGGQQRGTSGTPAG